MEFPHAHSLAPSSSSSQPKPPSWTWEENKVFENCLAEFDFSCPDLFEKIATRIPGKTVAEVVQHFEMWMQDVHMIDAGLIPLPDYENATARGKGSLVEEQSTTEVKPQYHRSWVPWSPDEHRLFLEGLEKYGKGDWKSISRFSVKTKNPTQVASHAQKYFLRLRKYGEQ